MTAKNYGSCMQIHKELFLNAFVKYLPPLNSQEFYIIFRHLHKDSFIVEKDDYMVMSSLFLKSFLPFVVLMLFHLTATDAAQGVFYQKIKNGR